MASHGTADFDMALKDFADQGALRYAEARPAFGSTPDALRAC
jgi:hypothetical protein